MVRKLGHLDNSGVEILLEVTLDSRKELVLKEACFNIIMNDTLHILSCWPFLQNHFNDFTFRLLNKGTLLILNI